MLQSHTIRGARLPSPLWYWEPDMDSGSGLGLAQKLRARIISRAHSRNFFATNVPPSFPLVRSSRAECHWLLTGDILQGPYHVFYWHSGRQKERRRHKNQVSWHINQRLEISWKEIGRPKVTDVEYNTVASYYIYNSLSLSFKMMFLVFSNFYYSVA